MKGLTFDEYVDQPFPVVTSYISKAHYGMMIQEPFDSDKHIEEDRRTCLARHMDLAHNQMRWYVQNVCSGPTIITTNLRTDNHVGQ